MKVVYPYITDVPYIGLENKFAFKLGNVEGVYDDKVFGLHYLIEGNFMEVQRCYLVEEEQKE